MSKATTPAVEDLVRDYEALLSGDRSKLDVLDESFTYHAPGMPAEGLQRAGFTDFLSAARQRFSDLRVTLENGVVGEEVTMQEWKMVGTHDGEVDGVPPSGREMELSTMTTTIVSDGKIQEVREYFDPQELQAQLEIDE